MNCAASIHVWVEFYKFPEDTLRRQCIGPCGRVQEYKDGKWAWLHTKDAPLLVTA